MNKRIIRIAAVLTGCILLTTGCIQRGSLNPDGEVIRFSAGTSLLLKDANQTKSGTLITGTEFSTNSAFHAWAWHSAAQQHMTFGSTTPITLGSNGLWDYAPHLPWSWWDGPVGNDYYDFLAVYPADKAVTHSPATPLKATVTYDATTDQYDLMAAGYRRTDKSITAVPLTFYHMLSAVSVEVKNAEGSVDGGGNPLTITFKSCRFVNLISSASVSITYNGGTSLDVMRSGDRSETPVLGPTVPQNTTLAPGASYPTTTEWDLMVPQSLSPSDDILSPTLQIVYNTGDENDIVQYVTLKDITKQGTNTAITEWEAGIQYHYQIELRIGVGIVVTVKTTPWEVVEAQTPGLMI